MSFRDWSVKTKLVLLLGVLLGALVGTEAFNWYAMSKANERLTLAIKEATLTGMRRLVTEGGRLFGAWPYRRYRFLFSLSDAIPHGGLEHHESNDSRSWERTLLDDAPWDVRAALLPHVYVGMLAKRRRLRGALINSILDQGPHQRGRDRRPAQFVSRRRAHWGLGACGRRAGCGWG